NAPIPRHFFAHNRRRTYLLTGHTCLHRDISPFRAACAARTALARGSSFRMAASLLGLALYADVISRRSVVTHRCRGGVTDAKRSSCFVRSTSKSRTLGELLFSGNSKLCTRRLSFFLI